MRLKCKQNNLKNSENPSKSAAFGGFAHKEVFSFDAALPGGPDCEKLLESQEEWIPRALVADDFLLFFRLVFGER